MLGLNKNKTKVVEDESIRDKSKFVVVGFTVMILSFLLFFIGEIYTSLKLSKQSSLIQGTGDVQDQADKIILEMAKAGKNVNQAEYAYIQEIMKFMSPSEFQNFKNSISGMASQFNVQINSLNESKPEKLGKKYSINFIEYQFLSTFENLTLLKNKISETDFKVNIIEEVILRENPKSKKVLTNGKIGVYVFAGKEKLLKEKRILLISLKKKKKIKKILNNNRIKLLVLP